MTQEIRQFVAERTLALATGVALYPPSSFRLRKGKLPPFNAETQPRPAVSSTSAASENSTPAPAKTTTAKTPPAQAAPSPPTNKGWVPVAPRSSRKAAGPPAPRQCLPARPNADKRLFVRLPEGATLRHAHPEIVSRELRKHISSEPIVQRTATGFALIPAAGSDETALAAELKAAVNAPVETADPWVKLSPTRTTPPSTRRLQAGDFGGGTRRGDQSLRRGTRQHLLGSDAD